MSTATFHPEMTPEVWNERSQGHLPGLIGVELLESIPGEARGRLAVRPDLLAPNGFLHAATIIGLADTLCGYGCVSNAPDGSVGFTTLETKSNHLGTARDGRYQLRRAADARRPLDAGLGRGSHQRSERQSDRALPLHADDPLPEGLRTEPLMVRGDRDEPGGMWRRRCGRFRGRGTEWDLRRV